MKKDDFENDLDEAGREPISRKRSKVFSFEEEDYVQRRKKSGKRSHRKLTHKDSFGDEQSGKGNRK